MGEDRKTGSLVPKAEALRKAGFSPVMTVVIVVVSMPGFWEFFFNKTGDEANKKAEVAYEVLVNEVKHLRRDDRTLRREITNLRQIFLIRSGMVIPGSRIGFGAEDFIDTCSDPLSGLDFGEDFHDEGKEAAEEETFGGDAQRKVYGKKGDTGPSASLDERIEVDLPDQQFSITTAPENLQSGELRTRDELPSLEDVMGK